MRDRRILDRLGKVEQAAKRGQAESARALNWYESAPIGSTYTGALPNGIIVLCPLYLHERMMLKAMSTAAANTVNGPIFSSAIYRARRIVGNGVSANVRGKGAAVVPAYGGPDHLRFDLVAPLGHTAQAGVNDWDSYHHIPGKAVPLEPEAFPWLAMVGWSADNLFALAGIPAGTAAAALTQQAVAYAAQPLPAAAADWPDTLTIVRENGKFALPHFTLRSERGLQMWGNNT